MPKPATAAPVITIDCHYLVPGHAAAFLIAEPGHAAFVDNNTPHALPHLLGALTSNGLAPEEVEYVIITHVHLDHAAGTAALLEACPNATVLAHPRAVPHLVDPARLIQSARRVYGDALFDRVFGTVAPVPGDRIRAVKDGEHIALGNRTLTFLHTAGHARHHICIHDSGSNGIFTGDTFGSNLGDRPPGDPPCLTASSPPTEFDPVQARESIRRIVDSGAERAYLTHFGPVENVPGAARVLLQSLDGLALVLNEALHSTLEDKPLRAFCEQRVRHVTRDHFRRNGATNVGEIAQWLDADARLNASGIAYVAMRSRKNSGARPA